MDKTLGTSNAVTYTIQMNSAGATWDTGIVMPPIQPPQFIAKVSDLQEHKAEIQKLKEHNEQLKARIARVREVVADAKGHNTVIVSLADLETALEIE